MSDDNSPKDEYVSWFKRDWEKYPPVNFPEKCGYYYKIIFADPIVKWRSYLLTLRGEPYYWYHKQYRRVPTVDQCYEHDIVCFWESQQQFERDRKVDAAIVNVLRDRAEECVLYEGREKWKCEPLFEILRENETNFFVKYGELGLVYPHLKALRKQQHRMAWERRHGPVGSGMKKKYYRDDGSVYYA